MARWLFYLARQPKFRVAVTAETEPEALEAAAIAWWQKKREENGPNYAFRAHDRWFNNPQTWLKKWLRVDPHDQFARFTLMRIQDTAAPPPQQPHLPGIVARFRDAMGSRHR
jgi:hypothetical protein